MSVAEKRKDANLLMKCLHEKNLLIFKEEYEKGKFIQVDISEVRSGDRVFFRSPDTLAVLTDECGCRFFKVSSSPFYKNGFYSLDLELDKSMCEVTRDLEPNKTLTSDTVIGNVYLRLV